MDICVGDRFYRNNSTVKRGIDIPDYLEVTKLIPMNGDPTAYIQAKYINRTIGTVDRFFSSIILKDSNLNPEAEDPTWIFVKKN